MSHVLVTGGSGYVGRFIVEALMDAEHGVSIAGRRAPRRGQFSRPVDFREAPLSPEGPPPGLFDGITAFVHAGFDHVPGRYRGGEGDDPAGFRARNLTGTQHLFTAAKDAGLGRVVFLSSRAVYGRQRPGERLFETTPPDPDTLYGEVKLEGERALITLGAPWFVGTSLRVTGVYGAAAPGQPHKWSALFDDYLKACPIAPRVGTEVHGSDVAQAVCRVLDTPAGLVAGLVFNVSDLVIDRRDVLAPLQAATGCSHPLPAPGDAGQVNAMDTARLAGLGWSPGGRDLFAATMAELVDAALR